MDQDDSALNTDQLTVTVPSNLVAQMDAEVGGEFVDRPDFVRSAIRFYLDYLRKNHANSPAADIG